LMICDKMADVKFWIEDPCILFTDLVLLPTTNLSRQQKLNALSRLVIIISIVLYMMDYRGWSTFALVSLMILALLNYSNAVKQENFTIIPTNIDGDFYTTVPAPIFAEEHRLPPPSYDHFQNMDLIDDRFEEPMRPQSYPYGQYLTTTNLLPKDEYAVRMNATGGARSAREYVNSTFTKHDLAFRENLMGGYHRQMNKRFRQNHQDTWSPYHSY